MLVFLIGFFSHFQIEEFVKIFRKKIREKNNKLKGCEKKNLLITSNNSDFFFFFKVIPYEFVKKYGFEHMFGSY